MARELRFDFPLPDGLHARPAALISAAAGRFASTLTLANRRSGRTANARSTLALVATLTRPADPCTLVAEGPDEAEALLAMRAVLEEELPRCEPVAPPARRTPGLERPLPRALRGDAARVRFGAAAGPGIALAPAARLDARRPARPLRSGAAADPAAERTRALAALDRLADELRAGLAGAAQPTQRAILAAHLAIVEDPELAAGIETRVASGVAAADAVLATAEHFAGILRASGTAYLAERADDLADLADRLVGALEPGAARGHDAVLEADAVGVAETLAPSRLLALDRARLKGLALGCTGPTSHTAILARALGIPAVTGVAGIEREAAPGADVVVDGERGLVVVAPGPAARRFYEREAAKLEALRRRFDRFKEAPGRTADGRRLEVAANVGSAEEARLAFANGADGIGLFRTELLFMGRGAPPSEDEQAAAYAEAAAAAGGRPVVIRTLDVGGDKPLPYLALPEEANPHLGFRAARIYAEHEALVAAQVRAILRAGAAGPVRIMFPMVSSLDEVRRLRALVRRCNEDLAARGVAHDPAIPVGVMVEVPSLALIADRVAREVDFLSVGSNDLAQYVFAADRGNERVAPLADPLHPGFVRLLADVVDGAHRAGTPVAICGELGGRPAAAPLLVGLGFDEVSLAAPGVAAMKAALAVCDPPACRALVAAATRASTAAEVAALLAAHAAAAHDLPLVAAETIELSSAAGDKEGAIRELVDLLHLAGRVGDPDRVEDAVWQREDVAPTAVGFGVAIPHCKSAEVLATSLAVVRCEEPVSWGAAGEEPVTLAILIAVSAGAPGDEHLRTIAALSRRLADDDFRRGLLEAASAAEVAARLGDVAEER